MSTTLKIGYLRLLRKAGKRSLISQSVFDYPYRISLGDTFSENPYYNDQSNVGEILATAAWVIDKKNPVVFDIGGHCGFIATQLAEILRKNSPSIYSFEPVPPTFSDLVQSVTELSLDEFIHPVAIALNDSSGFVKLSYSKFNSMLAQIIPDKDSDKARSASQTYIAPSQTLDEFIALATYPDVIKIDVEGWEVHVFAGAKNFLNSSQHENTGICLEWNPEALTQTGSSPKDLFESLKDYRFFYLNDYEGQRMKELDEIKDLTSISHVCNVFAIKSGNQHVEKWKESYQKLKSFYKVTV